MHAAAKRTALQARIAIAILSLNALALSKNVISLIIADLIKTYPEFFPRPLAWRWWAPCCVSGWKRG